MPSSLKRSLREEAGGKCANPGCQVWRTHLHHIRPWAVYKTHDGASMIAVCPSCHDEIHHGSLGIDDETLLRWKSQASPQLAKPVFIQAPPSDRIVLVAGTISFSSTTENTIFRLSNGGKLTMRLLNARYLQISLALFGIDGQPIVRVVENNVEFVESGEIHCDFRTGRARVSVPASYAPGWLIERASSAVPNFTEKGRIVALDMEVLAPGTVQISGFWVDEQKGFVISKDSLFVCNSAGDLAFKLVGEGPDTEIVLSGEFYPSFFEKSFPGRL